MRKLFLSTTFLCVFLVAGCQSIPSDALRASRPTLETRRMQTKKFDSGDEKKVLMACGSLLQDLGFNISESDAPAGLVVGQKDRSAVEAGQVAAKILVAVLGGGNLAIDKNQKLKASVVTHPVDSKSVAVRVTFQRIVFNEYNQVSKLQQLSDPKQYQEFFEKLSKSLFLNAQEIE